MVIHNQKGYTSMAQLALPVYRYALHSDERLCVNTLLRVI